MTTPTPFPVVAFTSTMIGLVLFALCLALQPLLWTDAVPSAAALASTHN